MTATTRLWKLEFADPSNPELGGTLSLLADGLANRLGSFDNMAFAVVGRQPKLYIWEDLGGDPRLGKTWECDIDSGQFEEIAQHDAERLTGV